MSDSTNETRELVYLAGLLHDIGKFYQRADPSGAIKSKLLSDEVKHLESVICPQYKGFYSHKHVLWTAQFFEDFEKHLAELLLKNSDFSYNSLLKLSAAHHRPDTYWERIIQKADHYSSGADRSQLEAAWKDAEEEDDRAWDSFRRIRMRSIFEGIRATGDLQGEAVQYKSKLPLKPMSLTDEFFPDQGKDNDYRIMWDGFASELKFVQTRSITAFSDTLLYLLEKYTSRIPASTVHLPDVSLFDHLKTTGAFALCLYDYVRDRGYDKTQTLPGATEKPFALIGGDLSGIQKFIYGIIARGAAKNLKGRSFYLQLLVDNIVRAILKDSALQLLDANVVYASGGGFYLLAPNKRDLPDTLARLENTIAEKLFKTHKTDLFLALDHEPFGEDELYFDARISTRRTIGDVWKALGDKLSTRKGQRFRKLLTDDFDGFFGKPTDAGGSAEKDAITGEELVQPFRTMDGYTLNDYTYQQIELGKNLKSTSYWVLSNEKLTYFKQEPFDPIGLGQYNYFLPKEVVEAQANQLRQSADKVRVVFFNEENFLEPIPKGIDNTYGFMFYGGNDYPESNWDHSPKTFEELAGITFADAAKEQRQTGPNLTRMGVLRMDVDNLGRIFRTGFAPDKRSFSRYSTLSRSLDYFFKGYLNTIWSSHADYKAFTQIIYAGGDDLFIVGKWDVLIRLAVAINQKFRAWTCQSPAFTLSGGVAIVGPKFPLLKSATMSDAYEKAAKNHRYGTTEKDAFALLGYTGFDNQEVTFSLNWNDELSYVIELKETIRSLLDNGLSQGFPSDVFNLMQQADFRLEKTDKDGTARFTLKNVQVIWLSAYSFKRAMQQGKQEAVKAFLQDWVTNIMTGKVLEKGTSRLPHSRYHALQLLALAARWATLEKRSDLNER